MLRSAIFLLDQRSNQTARFAAGARARIRAWAAYSRGGGHQPGRSWHHGPWPAGRYSCHYCWLLDSLPYQQLFQQKKKKRCENIIVNVRLLNKNKWFYFNYNCLWQNIEHRWLLNHLIWINLKNLARFIINNFIFIKLIEIFVLRFVHMNCYAGLMSDL